MSHFTIEELCKSDTALRMGIDNTPPQEVLDHMAVTVDGMEQVREALGDNSIHVNSGFRCEQLEMVLTAKDYAAWCLRHNRVRNQASWADYFAGKAHPQGYAVDFTCPEFGTPKEIVRALVESDIKYDQIIEEGTWVHISFDPRLRMRQLIAVFAKDGTPSYTVGIA